MNLQVSSSRKGSAFCTIQHHDKEAVHSEPSSITISKDRAGRYFVSMLCEFEAKPMPVSNKTVDIDLGLTDLFITSDGKNSGNPRHTRRYERKLAYLQASTS